MESPSDELARRIMAYADAQAERDRVIGEYLATIVLALGVVAVGWALWRGGSACYHYGGILWVLGYLAVLGSPLWAIIVAALGQAAIRGFRR